MGLRLWHNWQYTVDPTKSAYYWWTCVLLFPCLYNMNCIVLRAAFYEIQAIGCRC